MMRMFLYFIMAAVCLTNFQMLYAEGARRNDPRLTCKYFDSLSSNRNICSDVNRGRKVYIKKEGATKSLYLAAMKMMDSGAYREEWQTRKEYYSEHDMSFNLWMADLNGDEIEEAIVFPTGSENEFRGASGNGDIFVLKRALNKKYEAWKIIGVLSGNALHIESRKTNGYFNVIVHWTMGAGSGYLTRCKISNKTGKYEMVSGRQYQCTIESQEPCY
jgi:hypothetical protein